MPPKRKSIIDTLNNHFHIGRRNSRLQRSMVNSPRPADSNIPALQDREMPPIHLKTTSPDPQLSCPLYQTIPPEIRAQIFDYYFLEYTSSDPLEQYPSNTPYYRPGIIGKRYVSTTLLRTCRLIYLETYALPLKSKTNIFYHGTDRAPPPCLDGNSFNINPETRFFDLFQPWQAQLITSMHLFTQLFWLERRDCFGLLCKHELMQNVRTLKISIRRGDWWWNESNERLCMNPYTGNGESWYQMADIKARLARGENVPINENSWARFFADLKALETLEFELEASEDKKEELEAMVNWAKTWIFAMGERGELRAGEVVRESEWRTVASAWTLQCPYCHGTWDCGARRSLGHEDDPRCVEKQSLKRMNLGPMFIIRQMSWNLSKE